MQTPQILSADEDEEFMILERCQILELSNDAGDDAVSIARATVASGVTTAWHHLIGTEERYVILSGEGLAEVGDLPVQKVGPGDVVRIPAEVGQRIKNSGSKPLIFLAICTPRFLPECYVACKSGST